ncbi:MAG: hypothetical protein FJX59_01875 [Alphaproteobacteria bacterium]|nr:hypothetical protein [Alphaproteobacteria bacterium]
MPTPASLTLLTNPASTGNRAAPGWFHEFLAGEASVTIVDAATPAAVSTAVQECVRRKDDMLIVNGGDGTADLVFSTLVTIGAADGPTIFILPSGKTNMTTAAWCGVKDPRDALRRLLALRRQGDVRRYTVPRPIIEVRRGDKQQTLHGAFFGAADVVDGIMMCRRSIYPLGLPNAISHAAAISLMSWRAILGGSGKVVSATWPGGGEDGTFFFVGVTTLDHLILGLAPDVPNLGKGVAYISLGAGPRALLAALPSILSGQLTPGFRRAVRHLSQVTLRLTGAFTLDGELYEADANSPIEIAAVGPLNVIKLPAP